MGLSFAILTAMADLIKLSESCKGWNPCLDWLLAVWTRQSGSWI